MVKADPGRFNRGVRWQKAVTHTAWQATQGVGPLQWAGLYSYSIPWLLTQLGVRSSVSEVELEGKARKAAQAAAPGARQLVLHDVWYWASPQDLTKIRKMKFDLVTASQVGFPASNSQRTNLQDSTTPTRLAASGDG